MLGREPLTQLKFLSQRARWYFLVVLSYRSCQGRNAMVVCSECYLLNCVIPLGDVLQL